MNSLIKIFRNIKIKIDDTNKSKKGIQNRKKTFSFYLKSMFFNE